MPSNCNFLFKILSVLIVFTFVISARVMAKVIVHPLFGRVPHNAEVVAAEKQEASKSELLFFQDSSVFKTNIVTGNLDVFQRSHSTVILFTGVGGSSKVYGSAATSTLYFCNLAIKLGLFPVVLENPVYFGSRNDALTHQQRSEIAKQYSYLPSQISWYSSVIQKASENLQTINSKPRKLFVVGRSTGQALSLEVLHRAYHGNRIALEAMKRIDTILLTGLNTPAQPHYAEWTAAEDAKIKKKPLDFDMLAMKMDRTIYPQMFWAEKAPGTQASLSRRDLYQLPLVVAVPASQDEYFHFPAQLEVINSFAESHPQLQTLMIPTTGKHDPTASFEVDGKTIRNGGLLNELFKYLLGANAPVHSEWQGLRTKNLEYPFSPPLLHPPNSLSPLLEELAIPAALSKDRCPILIGD